MKTKLNIKSLSRLCYIINVSKKQLINIITFFEKKCHRKNITTKKGKQRQVVVVSREIKLIQRNILAILYSIYVHDAAHGWRKGRSIKLNAEKHCGNPVKLCLDIKNCFPNTHSLRIRKLFEEFLGCSPVVSKYLTRLTTFDYALPQGFVTSGAIIIILFKNMDVVLSRIARRNNLVYTRYGDDITFSGRYISKNVYKKIKYTIENFGIILNKEKEEFSEGKSDPLITGINCSGKYPKVPRSYKRKIRALKHKATITNNPLQKVRLVREAKHKELFIRYIERS